MKKSKTRIFVNKAISANILIYIKDKQHHFLKNVLRIKINDNINIFDGVTGEWSASVISINRSNTVLRVSKNISKLILSPDIWLIFAPIKTYRVGILIQKATELGVSKIIPCLTEYSNNKNLNIKSLEINAIEAAEQSERLDIPKVEKIIKIESLLTSWPSDRNLVFCDEKLASSKSAFDVLSSKKEKNTKWAVLVGPEGGFSDKEREAIMKSKKVLPISLGNRLLRSDTAITVSLFCIQQLF